MTALVELRISAPVEPWQRIGLAVHDGVAQVGGVRLRFVDGSAGVVGWGLDLAGVTDIDGLSTCSAEPPAAAPPGASGDRLGAIGLDHIVVLTSSLERTCGAIEAATGEPLKRIREAGPVRQGFHRLGEVIVEVVERADVEGPTATFWGFVWNVADIHETCAALGPDVVPLPRAAVQPGRFIASFRDSAGLCLPLAIMSAPAPRAHS